MHNNNKSKNYKNFNLTIKLLFRHLPDLEGARKQRGGIRSYPPLSGQAGVGYNN